MDKNDVKKSISNKLGAYYGKPEPEAEGTEKYNSYEEAKKAGDVSGMIGKKLGAHRAANRSVIALTNELYESLDIKQIMSKRKTAEKAKDEAKDFYVTLYDKELKKVMDKMVAVGGMGEGVKRVKAEEYLAANMPDALIQAEKEYKEAKKYRTALENCFDRYCLENKDIIEAERERKRRDEVLASGVLEELGV